MKALLIAVALAAGVGATALAATDTAAPAKPGASACFQSNDWQGWKAKDEHTMYLRVRMHDVYEVGFKQGCRAAQSPGAQLITVFHGANHVCNPIDLDIKVTDNTGSGFISPCIATSLRKLSSAEAKALPKKDQP